MSSGESEAGPLRVHAVLDGLRFGGAELVLGEFAEVAATVGIELSATSLKPLPTPAPAADRLRRLGLRVDAVPVTSTLRPAAFRQLRAHLAGIGPDLVHTHLGTADFLGGLAARSLRIPSVSTIHGDWWPDGHKDRVRNRLTAAVRRRAAAVLAVSESARAAYLAGGHDSPEHVIVMHNGIVDRSRPGSGHSVRRELGIPPDAPLVTALAALRPEKNFEASIDAVATLRDRFPELRLLIAGDGPHRDAVRRHAARLGEAVLMPGHREDVMAILDASDVLLQPSRFDAFPTSLMEAMAASVPVVATDVGGIPEIVAANRTGVLIPPPPSAESIATALAPLLADPGLRGRLGAAGRERYETEFGAEPWARRLRALYDGILGGPASGPGVPRAATPEGRGSARTRAR